MAIDLLDSFILWLLYYDRDNGVINEAPIENLNHSFIMAINDLWNYYRIENIMEYLSIFVCVL